jgi:hypothetical protein
MDMTNEEFSALIRERAAQASQMTVDTGAPFSLDAFRWLDIAAAFERLAELSRAAATAAGARA